MSVLRYEKFTVAPSLLAAFAAFQTCGAFFVVAEARFGSVRRIKSKECFDFTLELKSAVEAVGSDETHLILISHALSLRHLRPHLSASFKYLSARYFWG